jgi:hypothetical protein
MRINPASEGNGRSAMEGSAVMVGEGNALI